MGLCGPACEAGHRGDRGDRRGRPPVAFHMSRNRALRERSNDCCKARDRPESRNAIMETDTFAEPAMKQILCRGVFHRLARLQHGAHRGPVVRDPQDVRNLRATLRGRRGVRCPDARPAPWLVSFRVGTQTARFPLVARRRPVSAFDDCRLLADFKKNLADIANDRVSGLKDTYSNFEWLNVIIQRSQKYADWIRPASTARDISARTTRIR